MESQAIRVEFDYESARYTLLHESHSGNASNKITSMETIKSLKSSLTHESKVYYVADNSFYTEDNIKKTYLFYQNRDQLAVFPE
jgi:hypothetical protein